VLAAAYAAAGQFDRAVDTIQLAIATRGATPTADDLVRRQDLYRNHVPFREPTVR
jgi:hypothetical protein